MAKYAPWDFPERWLHELGTPEERNAILRDRMLSSPSWIHFLSFANALDWSEKNRQKTFEYVQGRFAGLKSGKSRQNIIFLLALTAADGKKLLNDLLSNAPAGWTAEDKDDLRCALAALGDEPAIEWFQRDFQGTQAFIGKPVFQFEEYSKEEEVEANRQAVRSYRFWEILFRRPYFWKLRLLSRSGVYAMRARETSAKDSDALAARLLPNFIAKWPGHPGCDDAALRLMNFSIERRDLKAIYLWAQRASLLPDQDCHKTAVRIIKALADSQLPIEALDEIIASDDGKQNRDFLRYQRFLRTARENAAEGIKYFDRRAGDDHSSLFAQSRQAAARVEPSAALRDGVHEEVTLNILRLYPDRSRTMAQASFEPKKAIQEDDYLNVLSTREKDVVLRTRLQRQNSIELNEKMLSRQYRLLVELMNLEAMENMEKDPELKADLRYRQAKLFYREQDILFPIWAEQSSAWGYALNAARFDAAGDQRLADYAQRTFALSRAYQILTAMLSDFPRYSGKHNVVFHMAEAYAKIMDYKPAKTIDAWTLPDKPPPGSKEGMLEFGHRRVGELFQKVVNEFPESNWADTAEKGAAWRLRMANLLRVKREKEEKQKAREEGSKEF
ncbi:MAG: hypothetical protein HY717_02155 [Planctomycetes bacterium]|nr:hypothetical protein [Planctomycetota bacterium]